ncbi:hypothetical protein ABEF91_002469 [Exophiala dermatitidis]
MASTTKGGLARSPRGANPGLSPLGDTSIALDLYHHPEPSDSYGTLLLPNIPSPSLCLDEMFQVWPSASEKLTPSPARREDLPATTLETTTAGQSLFHSLLDLDNYGSTQAYKRSPSLLPPVPCLLGQINFKQNPTSVDCQLSSPPAVSRWRIPLPTSDGRPDFHDEVIFQTTRSNSQLQECFPKIERPNTPVPSLTHLRHSTSSSGVESSPPMYNIFRDRLNTPSDSFPYIIDMQECFQFTSSAGKPSDSIFTSHSRDTSTTLSPASTRPDASLGQGIPTYQNRPAAESLPPRTVLRPTPDPSILIPTVLPTQAEVSYIDWDDDENDGCYQRSRLSRLKRSFVEMRTAERSIQDANARKFLRSTGQRTKETQIVKTFKIGAKTKHVVSPAASQRPAPVPSPVPILGPDLERSTRPQPYGSVRVPTPAKLEKRLNNKDRVSTKYSRPQTTLDSPHCDSSHQRTNRSNPDGVAPIDVSGEGDTMDIMIGTPCFNSIIADPGTGRDVPNMLAASKPDETEQENARPCVVVRWAKRVLRHGKPEKGIMTTV